MTFYLFRHGQTYFSKNHVPYGSEIETAEILAEGIPKIHDISTRLISDSVNTIYYSPIKRCVQTIEIIKQDIPGINLILEQRLEEEKITRKTENLTDITQRISVFLVEIKNLGLERVGVCTHGYPLAVLISLLKKNSVSESDLLNYPACGELVVIYNV